MISSLSLYLYIYIYIYIYIYPLYQDILSLSIYIHMYTYIYPFPFSIVPPSPSHSHVRETLGVIEEWHYLFSRCVFSILPMNVLPLIRGCVNVFCTVPQRRPKSLKERARRARLLSSPKIHSVDAPPASRCHSVLELQRRPAPQRRSAGRPCRWAAGLRLPRALPALPRPRPPLLLSARPRCRPPALPPRAPSSSTGAAPQAWLRQKCSGRCPGSHLSKRDSLAWVTGKRGGRRAGRLEEGWGRGGEEYARGAVRRVSFKMRRIARSRIDLCLSVILLVQACRPGGQQILWRDCIP